MWASPSATGELQPAERLYEFFARLWPHPEALPAFAAAKLGSAEYARAKRLLLAHF
jgi:hypothetical protein